MIEMYDEKIISYQGRPLFQTAKMVSPFSLSNQLLDAACFIYVLKGCNETVESNGLFRVSPQEGLIKSCGNFISNYYPDELGEDFEAVIVYLYPDVLREIYQHELPPFALRNAQAEPPKKVIGNELIHKYIANMSTFFKHDELMDDELARLKIKELVLILLKSNYFENVLHFFRALLAPKNNSFRQIIENNLFNILSVEQLAFLCNQSLSSFKRQFKSEFGESPARYIKHMRLEEAARKLLSTTEAISHIAFDCGFQDSTTFSASFNDHFSCSPRQFRLDQNRN
jgi:AraC-like DNA-binding protein/ribosomal protein S17E